MRKILTRRAALRAGAAALTAAAVFGATTAANASSGGSYSEGGYTVYLDTQAHWITAEFSGMNVSVADNSTAAFHRVIQWYNDGGAEQKWYFDAVYRRQLRLRGLSAAQREQRPVPLDRRPGRRRAVPGGVRPRPAHRVVHARRLVPGQLVLQPLHRPVPGRVRLQLRARHELGPVVLERRGQPVVLRHQRRLLTKP